MGYYSNGAGSSLNRERENYRLDRGPAHTRNTTMATQNLTQQIGIVAAVTATGLKLDEMDEWLTFSKFSKITHPSEGDRVIVAYDDRRFIHRIQQTTPEPAADATFRARLAVQPVAQPEQPEPALVGPFPPSKDRTITRLAVLNTATAILASGGHAADPDTVIALAARLEAWATRP